MITQQIKQALDKIRDRLDALEAASKIPELARIAATDLTEPDKIETARKLLFRDNVTLSNDIAHVGLIGKQVQEIQKLRAQNLAFREAMAFAYSRIDQGQCYHARIHLETVIRDNPEL